MKFDSSIFVSTAFFVLLTLVTGCGSGPGQDAEKLPNARVPLHLTAHEALSLVKHSSKEFDGGPETRTLISAASQLAHFSEAGYLSVQNKWLGSDEAACNFFVITALCEAGYCKNDKPFYRAAEFGSYFRETGWVLVSFLDAEKYLAAGADLDLVAQRGALREGGMGHIAIPIKINENKKVVVAQGNYHQSTHEVELWDDNFASAFHYFVNFAPGAQHASH